MSGAREQSGAPIYKPVFAYFFLCFISSQLEFCQQAGDLKKVGNLCSSASAMAAVVKILDSLLFQFLHCRGEEAVGFEVVLPELWDISSTAWLTG